MNKKLFRQIGNYDPRLSIIAVKVLKDLGRPHQYAELCLIKEVAKELINVRS